MISKRMEATPHTYDMSSEKVCTPEKRASVIWMALCQCEACEKELKSAYIEPSLIPMIYVMLGGEPK